MKKARDDSSHSHAGNPLPAPLLDYKSADAEVGAPRRPRRTMSKRFGIAFISTAFILASFWLCVELWDVWLPHAATYATALAVAVGVSLSARPRLRSIAAGILIAAAIWSLLLGTCFFGTEFGTWRYGTGWGVRPFAW